MAIQKIESQDLTLSELFNEFHIVPDYQREYVWGTTQVEQLLSDILEAFSGDYGKSDSEYFIGSIVCCPSPDGLLELIDGQQRMTTAYIFLCALRDHLQKLNASPISLLERQIADEDIGADGNTVFRYRLVLQYEDSRDVLKQIAQQELEDSKDETRSIENIRNAYTSIRAFLGAHFREDEQAARRYYAFFTKKVKLIRIKTQSVAHALKIFETINDRGKGLDAMDLLKNLMFMSAASEDFDLLKREWKSLVDTLYGVGEKPLRFLRYYIFAHYEVDRLREDEIYDWFRANAEECGYVKDPVGFVKKLLEVANAYVNFLDGKDSSGRSNRYLDNMRYLSGAARQHFILLLAARGLPLGAFERLCREVEDLFFVHIITRENTREFERKFARWAPELRRIHDSEGLAEFLKLRFFPAKQALAERFQLAIENLEESSIQKYRMRYILGKLTQRVNEEAYGSEGAERDLGSFLNRKIHVEHILAQNPSSAALQEFDRQSEAEVWIPMLGNLTLVEGAINTSLGNRPYSEKLTEYSKSKFLLTRTIAGDERVGVDTAVSRAVSDLESYELWTTASIQKRQATLGRLAEVVWSMPRPVS